MVFSKETKLMEYDDDHIVYSFMNLGDCLQQESQLEESIEIYSKALKLLEDIKGSQHEGTAHTIRDNYYYIIPVKYELMYN